MARYISDQIVTSTKFELAGSFKNTDPYGDFQVNFKVPDNIRVGPNQIIAYAAPTIKQTHQYNGSWSYDDPEQPNSTIYVFSSSKLRFIDPRNKINENARLTGYGNLTDHTNIPVVGANVSVYLDDNLYQTKITLEDGNIRYTLDMKVPVGSHIISLYYKGSEYLSESRANYTILVRSDLTVINFTLNTDEISVRDYIWLNGSIYGTVDKVSYEPITTKNMRANFTYEETDDVVVKEFKAENGTFNFLIYIPADEFKAGSYTVFVEFLGTELYSDDTSNSTQLFIRGKTNFEFEGYFIDGDRIDDGFNYTITRDTPLIEAKYKLLDNQFDGVGGRFVEIMYRLPSIEPDGIYEKKTITDSDGSFFILFDPEPDDPLGSVEIRLTFEGSNKLDGNTTIAKILIKSYTNIIINPDEIPEEMIRTEGYIITGSVIDDQDDPVQGEIINLFLGSDESTLKHFSANTDNDGRFTISILVPLSIIKGRNKVEIIFGETEKYDSAKFTYYGKIYAKPIITINSNTTIKKGEEFTISIILTEDNQRKNIDKAFIKITIDGTTEVTVSTNEIGVATYTGTFPKDKDDIRILATYSGSTIEYYKDTFTELTLKPDKTEDRSDYSAFSQYWLLIIGIIIIIFITWFWYRWRRQHITEVRDLLTN